jgi:hypothetical protein
MSDPILHIKDSFFFEVPKILAPSDFKKRADFPDVWISLDPDFQEWEFKRLFESLNELGVDLPPEEVVHHDWHEWVHGDTLISPSRSASFWIPDNEHSPSSTSGKPPWWRARKTTRSWPGRAIEPSTTL